MGRAVGSWRWRRRADSNRRIGVLQTPALDHLATSPRLKWCRGGDSNSYSLSGHSALNAACLPIPPPRQHPVDRPIIAKRRRTCPYRPTGAHRRQGLSTVGSMRKGHTLPPTWIPAPAFSGAGSARERRSGRESPSPFGKLRAGFSPLDQRQLLLPVVLPHREMLPKSEPLESTPTGAISLVAASHGIDWSAEA